MNLLVRRLLVKEPERAPHRHWGPTSAPSCATAQLAGAPAGLAPCSASQRVNLLEPGKSTDPHDAQDVIGPTAPIRREAIGGSELPTAIATSSVVMVIQPTGEIRRR